MPDEFANYGALWRILHPGWVCRDWDTTTELEPLVNAALFAQPPAEELHRCRADVTRLECLWKLGGVYVDTDVEPVRNLEPLLAQVRAAGATAFVVWSPHPWHGRRLVSNAVLGATPGHPWIAKAMAGLPLSVAQHPHRFLALQTVHYLTPLLGPLTRGVTEDGVVVLPPETFFPRSIPDRDKSRPVRVEPTTYGVHHWAHSRRRAR